MELADYVGEKSICMGFSPADREEAVRTLLERLSAAGGLPQELIEPAFEAVLARERLGSTAIGRGVAVPHARLEELDRVLVAFGYVGGGVEFSALDGEPVHQVFLVLAPKSASDEYVGVMRRITRLVQNGDFRRFVARAADGAAVLDLIREMDR